MKETVNINEVTAYKCSFCGKLYDTKWSCKSHLYRCYFNPRTKSCASCAFFIYRRATVRTGLNVVYRACMANINITKKMKTRCKLYLSKVYSEDPEIMDEVQKNYHPEFFIKAAIDRLPKSFIRYWFGFLD